MDLDIVELNNQDRVIDITKTNDLIIVNPKSVNLYNKIFYLKSKRIFNPDFQIIDSIFSSTFTRFFLKKCVEISINNPGRRRLKPGNINPDIEDIEKIKTFLYLYNATLEKDYDSIGTLQHGIPVYTHPIYYIELYDDPE